MSNEIIKKEDNNLQISGDLSGLMSEDMAGLTFTFPVIKVPSGGGLAFEVPSTDPNSPDLQKEFNAIILFQQPMMSYYKEKYTGGSQAPDCGSFDCVNGIERDTGVVHACKDCPYNQFGSGENGGKACKTKRRIYLLKEGSSLPVVLNIPTGSYKEFSNYVFSIVGANLKTNQVITKFSLAKAQNKTNITFSKVVLTYVATLNDEQKAQVEKMSEQVKALASRQSLAEADIEE